MPIQIRKLTLDDADLFFELRLESLKTSETSYLSTYEEESQAGKNYYIKNVLSCPDNNNVIFGAFLKSALIGFVGIFPATQVKISHRSLLWGMYVKSEYRRDGVARALLSAAVMHAKNNIKSQTIELSVGTDNLPAKKLYESFGFKAWGIEPMALRVDDKLYDEIHMKLIIEK